MANFGYSAGGYLITAMWLTKEWALKTCKEIWVTSGQNMTDTMEKECNKTSLNFSERLEQERKVFKQVWPNTS